MHTVMIVHSYFTVLKPVLVLEVMTMNQVISHFMKQYNTTRLQHCTRTIIQHSKLSQLQLSPLAPFQTVLTMSINNVCNILKHYLQHSNCLMSCEITHLLAFISSALISPFSHFCYKLWHTTVINHYRQRNVINSNSSSNNNNNSNTVVKNIS